MALPAASDNLIKAYTDYTNWSTAQPSGEYATGSGMGFGDWAKANNPSAYSEYSGVQGGPNSPTRKMSDMFSNFTTSGGSVLGDVFGGVKNIAGVLAPAALMTMGIPALMGEPGLGSALAANYAGAGAGAGAGTPLLSAASPTAAESASAAGMPTFDQSLNLATYGPVAAGAGIGAGASGAMGIGSPTGASGLGPSGIPMANAGGASSAPAIPGAAPAAAAGGGAAPAAAVAPGAAAAPGGAAATGGGSAVAGTGGSAVDGILGQLKKNALSLGIMALGLGGSTAAGNKGMPGEGTLTSLGNLSADTAKEYIDAARSGNLTAPQQSTLDQYTQQAKNQVRQYFASIGQGTSSSAMQAEQQVDQTALAMKQQLLQQTLSSGLQALGAAQGPLATVAQYQLGQDQALQQAIGRFATGAGLLAGQNAGTSPVASQAAAATQK